MISNSLPLLNYPFNNQVFFIEWMRSLGYEILALYTGDMAECIGPVENVIQGGPKRTERHTSGNKDITWLVSVDGLSSPEKNDTKISHFGSVVLILEHVMSANVGLQNFPFSGKTLPQKTGTIEKKN